MIDLTKDQILAPSTVRKLTGLGRTTIWRATREGRFPPPIKLSTNRIGWSRRAVEAWLEANTLSFVRGVA
jgi:prophage regulatory protein